MSRINFTERDGIDATSIIFNKEFRWIFREQPLVDVGIDALVEQVNDGNPTGKFIALQVKSGKGNFVFSGNKIIYYVSNVHYSYWLNFDIPVLLIAHLPDINETYWIEINKYNFKRTKKKWKLEIPRINKLNHKAKPIISKLLTDKNYNSNIIKIFHGENIDEQSIYDLIEKADCISDANDSTIKTADILGELTVKVNESNERFTNYNRLNKSFKSPEVMAAINSFSKNLRMYAKRLENENQIFSETIGQGIYGYQQGTIMLYLITDDLDKLISAKKSVLGIPITIDKAVNSIEFMRDKVSQLPESIKSLKEAKFIMLSVIDLMNEEYLIAKTMILNLITTLDDIFKNNS